MNWIDDTLPKLCGECLTGCSEWKERLQSRNEQDEYSFFFATISFRVSEFGGDKYHTCSDGCKDIFDHEPEKFSQAWLPVHQIFQGNCGGATVPEVLDWYHINKGADNMDYAMSPEEAQWEKWMEGRRPAPPFAAAAE